MKFTAIKLAMRSLKRGKLNPNDKFTLHDNCLNTCTGEPTVVECLTSRNSNQNVMVSNHPPAFATWPIENVHLGFFKMNF